MPDSVSAGRPTLVQVFRRRGASEGMVGAATAPRWPLIRGDQRPKHFGAVAEILPSMRRRRLWAVITAVVITVGVFAARDLAGPSRSACEIHWAKANDARFVLADRERYIDDCMTTGRRLEGFR